MRIALRLLRFVLVIAFISVSAALVWTLLVERHVSRLDSEQVLKLAQSYPARQMDWNELYGQSASGLVQELPFDLGFIMEIQCSRLWEGTESGGFGETGEIADPRIQPDWTPHLVGDGIWEIESRCPETPFDFWEEWFFFEETLELRRVGGNMGVLLGRSNEPSFLTSDVLWLAQSQLVEETFPSDADTIHCNEAEYRSTNGLWIVACNYSQDSGELVTTKYLVFDDKTGQLIR